jgi:hypothetical protein
LVFFNAMVEAGLWGDVLTHYAQTRGVAGIAVQRRRPRRLACKRDGREAELKRCRLGEPRQAGNMAVSGMSTGDNTIIMIKNAPTYGTG